MTPTAFALQQLLLEVSRHYHKRGFDQGAIELLRLQIITNTSKDGVFSFVNGWYNFDGIPISKLIGHFKAPRAQASTTELKKANAIFAFSCGYELGKDEFGEANNWAVEARRPGTANKELARAAVKLAKKIGRPLYWQFEIARAMPGTKGIKHFTSSEEELGTKDVIDQFVRCFKREKPKDTLSNVAVVAHDNHIERCVRLLELPTYGSITALPVLGSSKAYDPDQSQPRVLSQRDYIISDFVSMASMKRDEPRGKV